MGFARFESVLDNLQSVLKVQGLGVPNTFVGNISDRTAIQLLSLADVCGKELLEDFDWQITDREYSLVTVIGDASYDLPADFNGFIADSSWNRTTRLPAIGSLQVYEWQMLKARQLDGASFAQFFRLQEDQLVFYNTPQSVQTIVLPYRSRAWIKSVDLTYHDNVQADTDEVLYDPMLFQAKLRLAFLDAKGFDTTKLQMAFTARLNAAKSKDVPARTLSLSQPSLFPYLGDRNIPESGYGS